MEIAYILLVHDQPHQVCRLVEKLDWPGVTFFIHVDKKSDILHFESLLSERSNVIFIKPQIKIYWAGFNAVKATVNALNTALHYKKKVFDKFILLTGSDYPVKSNKEIFNFLSSSNKNYLKSFSFSSNLDWAIRAKRWHLTNTYLFNPRVVLSSDFSFLLVPLYFIYKLIICMIPVRRLPRDFPLYGGDAHWCIDRKSANYIAEQYENNIKMKRFFLFSHAPDETFFHTLLLNSPFSDEYKWGERTEFFRHNKYSKNITVYSKSLTYDDWNPERGMPAYLDDRDWDALSKTECLFARKFHPVLSKSLMDKIDEDFN